MFRSLVALLAIVILLSAQSACAKVHLYAARSSPGDLEVAGDLAGFATGTTRYVRYDDLLRLPQETFTVKADTNFHGETEISGIPLTTLADMLGGASDTIVAICYDRYRTNYPRDYLAAHQPMLVLRINRLTRDHWPPSEAGDSMGPYLISHPAFKPSFKILSHEDEPQIPYGVTRIEFRREEQVFAAIRPSPKWSADTQVQEGYIIARQDCFRCHNMGREGGTLAGRSWTQLGAAAGSDASRFRQIIRSPASVIAGAKMPAHSDYDDATLDALTSYFKTFDKGWAPKPRRTSNR